MDRRHSPAAHRVGAYVLVDIPQGPGRVESWVSRIGDPIPLAFPPALTCCDTAPGRTRTSNLLVRSQLLYPIELRALRSRYPTCGPNVGQLAGRHPHRTAPSLDPEETAVESYADHRYHARAASFSLRGSTHGGNAASVRMSAWAQSPRPDTMVGVAQLVRALGCGPRGRGFESRHPP